MNDNVSHPSHYTQGDIECIDAMESAFGKKELAIYCKIAAFKYIWRLEYKNGNEDVSKAIWYLNKYLELVEEKKEYKYICEECARFGMDNPECKVCIVNRGEKPSKFIPFIPTESNEEEHDCKMCKKWNSEYDDWCMKHCCKGTPTPNNLPECWEKA